MKLFKSLFSKKVFYLLLIMDILVNKARSYIDQNINRSPDYFSYRTPINELSPELFAEILRRMYMILYLTIDEYDKDSIYNQYCENFIENLSIKLIEELYIRCLRGDDKKMSDYIDYLEKVIKHLIHMKSDPLMEVFVNFGMNCQMFEKISNALMSAPDERMSPIKTVSQAFNDLDDIEDVKYYIYKTEIKDGYESNLRLRYEDIRLVFDYLNIPTDYKLNHHGESCIQKKCERANNRKDLKIITKNLESLQMTPSASSSDLTSTKTAKSSKRGLSAFLSSLIKTPREKTPKEKTSSKTPQ